MSGATGWRPSHGADLGVHVCTASGNTVAEAHARAASMGQEFSNFKTPWAGRSHNPIMIIWKGD